MINAPFRTQKNGNGSGTKVPDYAFLQISPTHPDHDSVQVGWAEITPAEAKRLLNVNVANRDLKDRGYTKLVEDQGSGSWNNENPDPIVIDENGRLINGQHRLISVIETGISIVVLVVIGVSESVMRTMDSGTSRNLRDVLTIENRALKKGHKNLSYLGGVLSACFRYQERGNLSQGGGAVYTHNQLLGFYESNRGEIEELVTWGVTNHRRMPATKNITTVKRLCAFRYALDSVNANVDDIDLFFSMLREDKPSDPAVVVLRKRLHNLQAEHDQKRKPSDDLVMALLIKGWNAFLNGDEPRILKWKSGGAGKEEFPKIQAVSE